MTDSDEAAKASFKECLLTSKEKKKSFLSKKKKKPVKKILLTIIKIAHTDIALTLWQVLL